MRFLLSTTQRCGSTWVSQMLAKATGLPCAYLDCTKLGFRLFKPSEPGAIPSLREVFSRRPEIGAFKTHDVPSKDFDRACEALPGVQLVTVSREFKDVVVSRYFYYRYYWPTQPALGPLPPHLAKFFESVRELSDRAALSLLVTSPALRNWATEWAAFEGPFSTPMAVRLSYEGLLTGAEQRTVERMIRQSLPSLPSFADTKRMEASSTGREGSRHFYREGRSGQWMDWFSDSEVRQIDAIREEMERACLQGNSQPPARK